MSAQANLFQNNISTGELVELVDRILMTKTQCCHTSFGTFKTKSGVVDHSVLLVITNNFGHHHTVSLCADTIHDLYAQVYLKLQEIAK
jgi:hypothetical protein